MPYCEGDRQEEPSIEDCLLNIDADNSVVGLHWTTGPMPKQMGAASLIHGKHHVALSHAKRAMYLDPFAFSYHESLAPLVPRIQAIVRAHAVVSITKKQKC